MNSVRLAITILGCFALKTAHAALGPTWTTPPISDIDGSGTIANALPEDTTTFPQLAITGAAAFEITSQTPPGVFEIGQTDGQLSLAAEKALDYETVKQHTLFVKADDGDTTTGTATIKINIADANDNAPAFPPSMYSACLTDKTKTGVTVETVSTTDKDTTTAANAISAMGITDGDSNNDFTINKDGILKTAKTLDMSVKAGYALQVEAVDSDADTQMTGTTTVFVTVAKDCGDRDSSGVEILAASLVTLLIGLMTSFLSQS